MLIGIEGLGVDPGDASAPTPEIQAADVARPTPTDGGADVLDATRPSLHVFLTSTVTSGNLAGVDGADDLCAVAASRAGLGGAWRAWLSGGGQDAISRITERGPYRLLQLNTLVVDEIEDLRTAGPLHAINVTEDGGLSDSVVPWVWTGTLKDAGRSAFLCNEWSPPGFSLDPQRTNGSVGSFKDKDKWTSAAQNNNCLTTLAHLYCFEVTKPLR